MVTQAIEIRRETEIEGVRTASMVRDQVNVIQEIMKSVMKSDVHYGIIPGCKKPSLYKAGSEQLLSAFRIAIDPLVEDLSTRDEARFRITAKATSMQTGSFLGSGLGECSSTEDKYNWRRAICDQEFESTDISERRKKWRKSFKGEMYEEKQVRVNIADVRNTVLKMAKKRAQIDVTLTVTAASDIFTQDVEDMPEEYLNAAPVAQSPSPSSAPAQPLRKSATTQTAPAGPPKAEIPPSTWAVSGTDTPAASPAPAARTNTNGARLITDKQRKRFWALAHGANRTENEVKEIIVTFGYESTNDITMDDYEQICAAVQA